MQPEYSDSLPPQQDEPRYPRGLRPPAPRQPGETPPPTPGPPQPGSQPQPRAQVRLELPDVQPYFTYGLLGIIVVVYLIGMIVQPPANTVLYGYRVTSGQDWLVLQGAKINELILDGGEYWRLLTSMFLHGGLAHLFFNGWALYAIGQGIERIYGHTRFLLIYFLGGLTGSVASMVLNPEAISVGASGALFAIFGAEMVFLYRHRRLFGAMGQQRLNNLIMLLVLNLFIGITAANVIDNWAHVGGFVAGVGLAWFIGPQLTAQRVAEAPGALPIVRLQDGNPLERSLLVPFLWAAGLLAVVGFMALT